jgi:hypothetical protein
LIAVAEWTATLSREITGSMRRILAALLALSLLCATPQPAQAQAEDTLGTAIGFIFLFAIDTLAIIGGSVTAIGSGVQVNRSPPALGWSIASIVVGVLDGLAGAITLAALVASDFDEDAPGFWAFAVLPLALCAANLTLGVVNIVRRSGATPDRTPDPREYEEVEQEEDEWSKGPAPGIGVSIAF